MRLASVRHLPEGAVAARDVILGPPGTAPLLRAGSRLSGDHAAALTGRGVHAVWVDDALSEDIAPVEALPHEMTERARCAVSATLHDAGTQLAAGQPLKPEVIGELTDVANAIAAEITDCPPAVFALNELSAADRYTHEHSVRVCTLGLTLALHHWQAHGPPGPRRRRSSLSVRQLLAHLGLGLLVHDIGKVAIPPEVLNKRGPLDEAEWALMRRHPDLGVQMLEGGQMSVIALGVVRSHHERLDGSGYPQGLAGAQIQDFAAIAGAADVFDAVCSARPYKDAAPPHVGVRIVAEGAGRSFDAELVDSFRQVVLPFPPGHEVTLPDGRVGVVSEVAVADPYRPRVRTASTAGGFTETVVDLTDRAPVTARDVDRTSPDGPQRARRSGDDHPVAADDAGAHAGPDAVGSFVLAA